MGSNLFIPQTRLYSVKIIAEDFIPKLLSQPAGFSEMNTIPGLTFIEEKCLSYSFINEVYGKNAYHINFVQNLRKF